MDKSRASSWEPATKRIDGPNTAASRKSERDHMDTIRGRARTAAKYILPSSTNPLKKHGEALVSAAPTSTTTSSHNSMLAPDDRLARRWEGMAEVLRLYKEKHGDCLVPRTTSQYRKLGNWVGTQRLKFRNGTLLPQRKTRLDAMGFVYDAGSGCFSASHRKAEKEQENLRIIQRKSIIQSQEIAIMSHVNEEQQADADSGDDHSSGRLGTRNHDHAAHPTQFANDRSTSTTPNKNKSLGEAAAAVALMKYSSEKRQIGPEVVSPQVGIFPSSATPVASSTNASRLNFKRKNKRKKMTARPRMMEALSNEHGYSKSPCVAPMPVISTVIHVPEQPPRPTTIFCQQPEPEPFVVSPSDIPISAAFFFAQYQEAMAPSTLPFLFHPQAPLRPQQPRFPHLANYQCQLRDAFLMNQAFQQQQHQSFQQQQHQQCTNNDSVTTAARPIYQG